MAPRSKKVLPPSPMMDMAQYVEKLASLFMLPYPAIFNSLGVERSDVKVDSKVTGLNGVVTITAKTEPETELTIVVKPDGTHDLMGFVRGEGIHQKFGYKPLGFGRGVQEDISHFIEENLPASFVYEVVDDDSTKTFDSVEDLTKKYPQVGVMTSSAARKELQGQPRLEGLLGPMFNGRRKDTVIIRYESQSVNDSNRYASVNDKELRSKVIRLAHQNPALRPHLLPILKEAGRFDFVIPRNSYIPKDVEVVKRDPEGTDLEIVSWPSQNGKIIGIAFQGKSNKPLWHHSYRDMAAFEAAAAATIKSRKAVLDMKAKQMQERKDFKHSYEVGDVLYTSWGYEQTNVDFYEIVEVPTEKSVKIRAIGSKIVDEKANISYVVPDKGTFKGPPTMKKVSPGGSVNIDGHGGHKWEGKPVYETSSGWGH